MIVNAILNLVGSLINGLFDIMPHLAVPSWISGISSNLATVTGALSGTSNWLPWDVLALGVALTLSGVGVGVAIKGIRIVASFLTAGGGSTG
jgi:hypothetical protein